VPVCPTGASYKRAEDGIVLVDYDKCIGCKYCAWACPYGVRELDEKRQVMTKCTLCIDRIEDRTLPEAERKPACVLACPTQARLFGDVHDPDSEASRAIAERGGYTLMPEMGTRPANHYPPIRPSWCARTTRCASRGASPSAAARRCRATGSTEAPMHPPWSMIFFTTLVGAAQGLMLTLAGIDLASAARLMPAPHEAFLFGGAIAVLLLCAFALAAASFHLGHPLRAWRAAAMWRTSWLSREVIVLPLFIGCVGGWAASLASGYITVGWALSCIALALLLYLCTGMIYASVKAMRQWSTPMVPLNFTLLGIASGLLLATALASLLEPSLVAPLALAATAALPLAWLLRIAALWRNLRLEAKTTLQSAIGVRHPRIVPISAGMTAPAFGQREFEHGHGPLWTWTVRAVALLLGAALPLAVLVRRPADLDADVATLLFVAHWLGLLAERWSFFTEAQHTQNLYRRGS
jgi:DMSO reductase anchor subunit/ferredoxin